MEIPNDSSKNDLDKSVKEIQEKIMAEIRRNHSPIVIDHWQNPRNWGIMPDADGYARITGPCGDTMEVSIEVNGKKIVKCTFDTDGCGTTIACGSIITVMVTAKTLIQARQIDQRKILEFCGGLPEDSRHCALLAANTMQKAIDDYEKAGNAPWKKFYRCK